MPGMGSCRCLFFVVELGQNLVAHVAVGPDVLNIIAVLKRLDDPEHLAGAIKVELDLHSRDEGGLSRVIVDVGSLQSGTDGHEVARLAHELEGLTDVVYLFPPRGKDDLEQVVLAETGLWDDHDALAGKHVGHASGVGELATVAVQRRPHLGSSPVGGVPLVGNRLPVGAAGRRTAAPLDGVGDVVVGDAELLGPLNGIEQRRVTGEVTASGARSHLDVLDHLGKQLAAFGVDDPLLVLRRCPFGMTAHRFSLDGRTVIDLVADPTDRRAGVQRSAARTICVKYSWMRWSPVTSGWKEVASRLPDLIATTLPAAGPRSTLASTCTPSPICSTQGALMKTALNV